MNDERFQEALDDLRHTYNPPPETPRDEMWAAIRAGAQRSDLVVDLGRWHRARSRVRRVGWALAAAALLILGIGIGRVSTGPDARVADGTLPTGPGDENGAGTAVAEATTPPLEGPAATAAEELAPDVEVPGLPGAGARADGAFRFAAVSHLLRSESLLTMVRADSDAGRYDAAVGGWARELLTETRLLMDSPAAEDPAMAQLLADLELILVQLVGITPGANGGDRTREELELVNQGIERQDMLLRIQAVVPARAGLLGA